MAVAETTAAAVAMAAVVVAAVVAVAEAATAEAAAVLAKVEAVIKGQGIYGLSNGSGSSSGICRGRGSIR